MATKSKVKLVKLQCTKCKKTNYFTKKSNRAKEKKLDRNKFCNTCRAHTLHKESKK